MKKILFLILISFGSFAQNFGIISSINLGGNGVDEVKMAISSQDGNIIILGATTSNNGGFSTNHGMKDIFVLKVDTLGNTLWIKLIGGSKDDSPLEISQETNGNYKILSNSNSTDGDFLVVNTPYSTFTSDGGYRLMTLSSDGISILESTGSSKTTNMGWKPEANAFTKWPNGSDLILYHNGFLDCGQYPNHCISGFGSSKLYGMYCGSTNIKKIKRLSNGEYLGLGNLSGATGEYNKPYGSTNSCGPEDIILQRYSNDGTKLLTKLIGGTGYDYGVDFEEYNNYIYLTANTNSNDFDIGSNYGSIDIYVAKLDLNGNIVKDTVIATSGRDIVNKLRITSDGKIQLGGFSNGFYMQFYELNTNLDIIREYNNYNPNNGYAIKDILEINGGLYFISESSFQGPNGGGVLQGTTSNSDIYLLKAGIISPITLGSLSSTKYCIFNNIQIPFTSTLSSNTAYTAQLFKGNVLVASQIASNTNNINMYLPSTLVYGTDYYVKVISGNNSSQNSPLLSIGTLLNDSNNRIEDENQNILSNLNLCPSKTRSIKLEVFKLNHNPATDPVEYIRFKNGIVIDTNSTGSFIISSAGSYSFNTKQAGCSISQNIYANQSSNVSNYITNVGFENICLGESRKISSNYYSTTAQFQWLKNGQLIANSNFPQINATQTGTYKVNITEPGCTISPSSLKLNFNNGLNPILYLSNNDSTICSGSYKYISTSTFQNSINEFQYQWYKNGVPIGGAISTGYSTNQPGKYYLEVKQGNCTSNSRIVTLVESNKAQKPDFSLMQYTQICAGSSVRIQQIRYSPYYNTLEYNYPYGYWYKDGVKLNNYQSYYYDATTSGNYKMVVSEGTSCQNDSDPINITIGQMYKPKILSNDNRTTICGNNLNLRLQNLNVSQNNGYTYQWKLNNANLINETSQYLYPYSTAGAYSLVVSNGACSMESDPINITLSTSNLTLLTNKEDLACTNSVTKISVKELSPYGYFGNTTWYKNGIEIPDEKEPYLFTSSQGVYHAVQSGVNCPGTSNSIEIKSGPPSGYFPLAYDTVPSGQNTSISISGCNGIVKWYDSQSVGNLIFTGNTFTTPNLTQNTSYWVSCTKDYCESSRIEVIVSVGPSCLQEIVHTSSISPSEYKSSQTIISSIDVPNGVKYSAGYHIVLNPGFSAGSNEVFEAVIGGCQN